MRDLPLVLLVVVLAVGAGVLLWPSPEATDDPPADESSGLESKGEPSLVVAPSPSVDDGPSMASASPGTTDRVASGEIPALAPPLPLEVHVVWEDGGPAEGLPVVYVPRDGTGEVPATVDATGRARFSARLPGTVLVRRLDGQAVVGRAVRALDAAHAETATLRVPGTWDVRLQLRRRGEPFLPRPFRISLGAEPVTPTAVYEESALVAVRLLWDPTTAPPVLRLDLDRGTPVEVRLPYLLPEGTDTIVELDACGTPLEVEVVPSATAEVHLLLQRWDVGKEAWTFDRALGSAPASEDRTPVRVARIEGLCAGRYRALAPFSRTSEEVTLAGAPAAARLRVDVSSWGVLRGRVEGPEGVSLLGAQVLVSTPGTLVGSARISVGVDGGFEVAVPDGLPLLIEASNSGLSVGARGRAAVSGWRDPVVLRMVRGGGRVRFRLRDPDGGPWPGRLRLGLPYMIRPGPAEERRICINSGEAWEVSGFPAGRTPLWFDTGGFEPLLLPEVDLGSETTDLGELRLSAGETIRIVVQVPDGAEPPVFTADAESLDPPTFHRLAEKSPDDAIRIRGLRPGRHRVTVHGPHGPLPAARGLEQVVEVRPGEEAVIYVDFRPGALDPVVGGR